MRKRLITGAVYVAVLLGFYTGRVMLNGSYYGALVFDALILLFSALGTFEMCRALGDRIDRIQRVLIQIFSAGTIFCFALSDSIFRTLGGTNYASNLAFTVFMAGTAALFSLLVFRHAKTSLASLACSLLAYLYPSIFLLVLSGINHMPRYAEVGLLFVFAICPFSDCFAFLFGKLLKKKFPLKLAPNVSPNKTLIGGLGGLIGGAVGAVCIFFAYYGLIQPADINLKFPNLIFFLALGVLTSAFAELGDLVESAVKRNLGIKDMGNLLPGHGGILDRIDSALYASLIVCFVLVIRLMTTG